jgi:hypothetical protein
MICKCFHGDKYWEKGARRICIVHIIEICSLLASLGEAVEHTIFFYIFYMLYNSWPAVS